MNEMLSKLDLDIIRTQAEAYELLKNSALSPEEVETFTKTLSNIVALGLSMLTIERGLTEDEAMALLVLTIMKATEVMDAE